MQFENENIITMVITHKETDQILALDGRYDVKSNQRFSIFIYYQKYFTLNIALTL